MTTTAKKQVVVVDDEEGIVFALQRWLSSELPHLASRGFTDSTEALAALSKAPPDLLITDLSMPGTSGAELVLKARQVSPRMPAIVVTGRGVEQARSCIPQECTRFFGKPLALSELRASVEELLAPSPGFVGAVSLPLLPDLIQLLCLSRANGGLHIENRYETGAVWFEAGEIVHAECGELMAEAAVYRLLTWASGQFSVSQDESPKSHSITARWQELLLEGCRLLDEDNHAHPASLLEDRERAPQPTSSPEPFSLERKHTMANVKETLGKLSEIDGFMAASIVDSNSGMMLGSEGGGINLEVAAAGNTEVVRAKRKTLKNLALKETIDDILITLNKQYHLIRPLASSDALFVYLVLDRGRANLAMARHTLSIAEKDLVIT